MGWDGPDGPVWGDHQWVAEKRSQAGATMLELYTGKRDFERTPEPSPSEPGSRRGPLLFVVQQHAARRLHYDLRLEVDGVLKSWAVPKGPSLHPGEKRLAVMVEDHPLDYSSFEGIIPRGEYGAGQVIVWDAGRYFPDEGGHAGSEDRDEAQERVRRGLSAGKLSIFLEGEKLRGSWALVRMKASAKDWLLIKHDDEFADPGREVLQDDRSVLSGASLDDLKAGRAPGRSLSESMIPVGSVAGARPAPLPTTLTPMLPTLTEAPFSHPDWIFEPKLDGIRVIASLEKKKVKLLSRGGLDATAQYPALARELGRGPSEALVLDGEIVVLDEGGRPSFQRLQERLHLIQPGDIQHAERAIPVIYYVFDLLYLDGFDLRRVPLKHRRPLLEAVLPRSDRVRLVECFPEDGETAYRAITGHGLEGVIAKHRDSLYEAGRRSRQWLKVKATRSDDFVIGGYSQGSGARADTFGALLLGTYNPDGRLDFVGHVGTGFDDRTLQSLRTLLDSLGTEERPFVEVPLVNAAARWVRPELVAEIKFARRTQDGRLREPVFLRLRRDKAPAEATGAAIAPTPTEAGDSSERGPHRVPAGPDAVSVARSPRPSPGIVEDVLAQLAKGDNSFPLQVEGHEIGLTNLDKVLWPPQGGQRAITKRDLIAYLAQVSPYALPHLKDRPLTLVRCPDGLGGQRFYQKHIDQGLPEFVDTVRLFSEHGEGDRDYLMGNNLATLLWLGQIAGLELHTWYSRTDPSPDGQHLTTEFCGSERAIEGSVLNHPDFVVFDLDPYVYSSQEAKGEEPELNRVAYARTCEVAHWLKEILDQLSLAAFVKTSGRTGLHVFVPVRRQFDYYAMRSACETIGRFLLSHHPRDVTMEWSVSKRTGKVFLDHKQNVRGKTLASIFSPRLAPGGTVSMPVTWDEIERVYPTDFTILSAPARLKEKGDPWSRILDAKHDLRTLLKGDSPPSTILKPPLGGPQKGAEENHGSR